MGRKNNIEGQLNLFDLWTEVQSETIKVTEFADATESAEATESADATEFADVANSAEAPKPAKSVVSSGLSSFPECGACWCANCEHSSKGGGKPRPFGDAERVCPSCEMCAREGKADVCVIGSAEEGCRFRAEKEGLMEVYEE